MTRERLTKQKLRQRLLQKLRQQPKPLRRRKSLAIATRVRRLPIYRRAKILMCYVAVDGEVETRPFLSQAIADGKRVAVPAMLPGSHRIVAAQIEHPDQDLKSKSPFGVPQPGRDRWRRVPLSKLDLVLIPGVAFDKKRRRLGRGGGHFDRFLERLSQQIPSVGLAFQFQVLKNLPWELHDQPVWRVMTEKGIA